MSVLMRVSRSPVEERVKRLRELRDGGDDTVVLAACDPAQVYGAALPWPRRDSARAARVAGAQVVQIGGEPVLYVERGGRSLVPLRDPDATWLHVDPRDGTILQRLDRSGRINRWLFDAAHRLDLPDDLRPPVVEAMAPYHQQIALLNAQIGGVVPRQSMKDASGASQMDARTQVSSLHGTSMLHAATLPFESNVALAPAGVKFATSERSLVSVKL